MTRWIGAAWVVGVALACAHAGEAGDGEHVIYRARAFGHTIGSYRELTASEQEVQSKEGISPEDPPVEEASDK